MAVTFWVVQPTTCQPSTAHSSSCRSPAPCPPLTTPSAPHSWEKPSGVGHGDRDVAPASLGQMTGLESSTILETVELSLGLSGLHGNRTHKGRQPWTEYSEPLCGTCLGARRAPSRGWTNNLGRWPPVDIPEGGHVVRNCLRKWLIGEGTALASLCRWSRKGVLNLGLQACPLEPWTQGSCTVGLSLTPCWGVVS